jgi:uncharacterized protein YndB with AHSA1/START domain
MPNETKVELKSDREVVVTRTFDAPARIVFEAWVKPDLFMQWWAPKSLDYPLRTCEMDVREGGTYRLEFGKDAGNVFEFFGRYLIVEPPARLSWTNDEESGGAVTTVTFEERGNKTFLAVSDLYPSKEALEANRGAEQGLPEQFGQLDELLATLV